MAVPPTAGASTVRLVLDRSAGPTSLRSRAIASRAAVMAFCALCGCGGDSHKEVTAEGSAHANDLFFEAPAPSVHGWWRVVLRMSGRSRYVVELCAPNEADALGRARAEAGKRLVLPGLGSTQVVGAKPDPGCRPGAVGFEAW